MTNKSHWLGGILNYFSGTKHEPVDIEGHVFPPTMKLGRYTLVLNGAGARTQDQKKIYALGLYLPEKTQRADTARALLGARRIRIIALDALNASQFINSLHLGIANNTNETSQSFIRAELVQIEEFMHELSGLEPGDVVDVDWIPARGTFVYYNGQLMGNPVRGKALYDAILSIWVGKNSLENDLKKDLLDWDSGSKPS